VPVPAATEPAGGGADEGYPKTEAELDAELERELERQLAMESDPVPLVEPEEPPEPAPTPVPRELIAEIEAFKDQVRRGPGKAQASAKPSGTAKVQDPTALRLTAAQQAELPPFLMTVHVYVPDKTRRFVMINGLKYGEGEKTREDLTVEQILPNGAVLGFQGNPFYVHR
jgi:general secretion pathway protein B